jgi:dTDP-4-dehydrorhamnose 3,5-epimerase-like enzyme
MNDALTPCPTCRVAELRLANLPQHVDADGSVLTVVEGKNHVAFPIARIFTLQAPIGTTRGMHAHRRCAQFMICPQGAAEIVCDDASEQRSFLLDRGYLGLLIPPTLWVSEIFRHDNSVLIVVCDRPYEADDYIRDYADFVAWRRAGNAPTEDIP